MAQAVLKIKIWTEGRGRTLPKGLSDIAELFAPHAEHVADLCAQGYQSGEIVDDKFSGWWSLEREAAARRRPPTKRRAATGATAAI